MKTSVPLAVLVLLSAAGCSIKEDRSSCPCYLTLQTDAGAGAMVVDWFIMSGSYFGRGELNEGNGWSETLAVPRDDLSLLAASGAGDCLHESGEILIPEGHACPPVFLGAKRIDTRCNSMEDTIHLHKNYAELRIHGVEGNGLDYELSGDVCGYAQDGRPLEGPFHAAAVRREESCICRVPRQINASLRLSALRSGTVVRSFPIGEYIMQSGYDWLAEDLPDIDIRMDLEDSSVEISTSEWRRTLTFYIDF